MPLSSHNLLMMRVISMFPYSNLHPIGEVDTAVGSVSQIEKLKIKRLSQWPRANKKCREKEFRPRPPGFRIITIIWSLN